MASIGEVDAHIPDDQSYAERFALAESNDVRCPDPDAAEAMRKMIWDTMQAKDTLGGVFEIVATGVPPGLGSHVHFDRKLDGQLAAALMSIQAIKGVEIGPAFANARLRGTQVHDEIMLECSARAEPAKLLRPSTGAGAGQAGSASYHQPRRRAGGRHHHWRAARAPRGDETDRHDADADAVG